MRLYFYLHERGFKPCMVAPDARRPDYNNWLYKRTPELLDAVDQYYSNFSNNK